MENKSLFKGFIKEVFALVGIVGGIFIASRASKDIGDLIAPILALENSSSIKLMGFICGLIGFWVIMYLLGLILSRVSSMSGLGFIDRIFGFIFGAGKIFLILAIIIYSLSQIKIFKDKVEKKLLASVTYPLLLEFGSYIIQFDITNVEVNITNAVDTTVGNISKAAKEVFEETIQETKDEVNKISNEIIEEAKQKIQNVEESSQKVKQKIQSPKDIFKDVEQQIEKSEKDTTKLKQNIDDSIENEKVVYDDILEVEK